MKPKRKSKWNFDNINWEEFMSHQFLSIYNLDKKPCQINSCKKNCSDNLYCINKLGETKWLNNKSLSRNDKEDNGILNSDTNFAAGLKNYGNTCYFNSLLQVYFNIVELKEAIFRFPVEDIPDEIITYLQTIFAQMQLSVHKMVDPVELINALELPQLEQQDAPEFHSLFMNLVDQRFSLIDDNVIKSLISGTFRYLTRCKGCGYESQMNCQFREIDLKPMLSFDQALLDFLKVELLTDDNKYDCSCCMHKCNGERQTVLQTLPPLLCFQFLRYSYDNSGTKKKNCCNVGFPSYLSMENYVNDGKNDDKTNEYIIKAVLIHIGLQPTSGHYQTLIHTSNQDWILYDDLNVQKLENIDDVKKILGQKKTVVNKSDFITNKKNGKEQQNIHFVSSNAYMVFYEREDVFKNHTTINNSVEVPSHLKGNIQMTNESYLTELENQRQEKVKTQEHFIKESETIIEAFQKLFFKGSTENLLSLANELEFLPMSWLTKWLTNGRKVLTISNSDGNQSDDLDEWKTLICRHEMLGPDIPNNQLKIVNSVGVDFLIENFFIPVTYKRKRLSSFCNKCWRLKFEIKKFENISRNDFTIDNFVRKPLLENVENQKCYWVSKSHLRQWRKVIRLAIENKFNDSTDIQDETNSSNGSFKDLPCILNSDLLCPHENLSIDTSKRVLLGEELWNKILDYFPKVNSELEEKQYLEFPLIDNKLEGCSNCSSLLSEILKKSEIEKVNLSKIFNSKKRFEYNNNEKKLICLSPSTQVDNELITEEVFLYFIPSSFIAMWKRFIKNPSVDTLVTEIDYSEIFCQHGKFLSKDWYHFIEDESIFLVWQSEWDKITNYYPDIEFENISIKSDFKLSSFPTLVSSIIVCNSCFKSWSTLQTKFENSVIYIRLISTKDDHYDVNEDGPSKKKYKVNNQINTSVNFKEIDPNTVRRSARSKRHRNDIILKINSDDTIKDIKLQLMNIYSVSPMDQHLIFNELELVDSNLTISNVGIKPASILYLILDTELIKIAEPSNDNLEIGFSGTKLMQSLR